MQNLLYCIVEKNVSNVSDQQVRAAPPAEFHRGPFNNKFKQGVATINFIFIHNSIISILVYHSIISFLVSIEPLNNECFTLTPRSASPCCPTSFPSLRPSY